MSNQDENPQVVNKLAELRKKNNNFQRDAEEEKKEQMPTGSSLVDQPEQAQINSSTQIDQNNEEEKVEKPNIRAMIRQKYDQIVDDDGSEPVDIIQPHEQIGQGEAKESIKVAKQELDELDTKYPNGLPYKPAAYVEPTHDEEHLDIAHLVQEDKALKEKANFFVCSICTMVVKEPLECSGCQTLFCTRCIDPWRQNNSHCPKKCKGNDDVEFRAVHRYVSQEILSLKFKCNNPGCDSVNEHNKAIEHVKQCDKLTKPCVQGCGLGIVGDDMTYHCVKQCHFYKINCEKCGEFSAQPNKPGGSNKIEDHDCFQVLMQALKEEREKVAALQKENEELKKGGASGQGGNTNADGLKCAEAHDMVVHRGTVDSYQGNPRCDLCMTEDLNRQEHFFRCPTCDFDQCAACSAIIRQDP